MTTTRKGQILFIVLNDSVKISLLQIRKIVAALWDCRDNRKVYRVKGGHGFTDDSILIRSA